MPHATEKFRLWLIVGVAASLIGCGGGGGGNNDGGSGNDPGTGEAQPDVSPPSPPTTVSATAASASSISITWSGAVDTIGIASYKVYRGGTAIATVTSTSHTETGLNANTRYCYDITAADAAGNESVRSAQSCATTTANADTAAPTITSIRPASDATNVAVDTTITVQFGEAMNASSLNSTTFKVVDARDDAITGTITTSGTTATFTPTDLLAVAQTYTITIAGDVRDLAGNTLGAPYSATFKTGLATYAITAIGDSASDESFTLVNDLNEKGEVAGELVTSTSSGQESGAFLWREGRFIDLGALSTSVRDSRAQGLNDRSEASGWSYADGGQPPGFMWRENTLAPIGLEDAFAINNSGRVVGYVTRVQGSEAVSVAVAWQAGQVSDLSGLANPWNINDAGDVVGFSATPQGDQASLWRAGVVTLLGMLPGALGSQAFDINTDGLIIGTNQFAPPTSASTYERAFSWQAGRMTELPRVATNHSSSNAYGVNDRGHVVGRSGTSQYSAAVWLDGKAYDLNELIATDDPLREYVTLLEAREINNRGQIIAQGTDSRRSGSYTGFLLTPKRAR